MPPNDAFVYMVWYGMCQLSHLAVWGSIVSWFLFLAIYPYMWPTIDLAPEMVGMVCTSHLILLLLVIAITRLNSQSRD